MTKVKSVSVRLATEADSHLDTYDNTKLVAVNTCPTWGIVRYDMHLTFPGSGRAMALEAGSAMHEVFAAVRLWQLWKYDLVENKDLPQDFISSFKDVPELVKYHGIRLFGAENFQSMLEMISENEDDRTNCLNFCLQSLYNSGFYDDPSDNRRTMSNLEEAAIMYIDRWDFNRHPIWIRDISDPQSDVGIEIAFDVVITYEMEENLADQFRPADNKKSYRFTGKLDGLHWRDGKAVVGENKTAARMDEAWRMSFEMAAQLTGYVLVGNVFSGEQIDKAILWGVSIPLPKTYDNGGLVVDHFTRPSHMIARWFDWFLYSVQMYERNKHDPINAPKFTHSCNRYFRACSMIPFCTAEEDEMKLTLSEMEVAEWSPLHERND